MKIHLVRAELFHADGWMDRRTGETDAKMIIVTLHKFVNTPTNTKT